MENLPIHLKESDQNLHVVRIGWSVDYPSYQLGARNEPWGDFTNNKAHEITITQKHALFCPQGFFSF